ncbi:unnamed protein product [Spirodela intermedia]|uniref:Uncharacterized protein n=1 Tax=Spirodela intermedia TaxID=51605 RepID=A0A7I8KF64_SPIIN|nr:unnamed protein product [Spirodela intermedia]
MSDSREKRTAPGSGSGSGSVGGGGSTKFGLGTSFDDHKHIFWR